MTPGKLSDRASDSALSPSVTNTSNDSSWVARHFNFWKKCAWVPLVCCGGWKLVRRTLHIYYFFYYYWWLLQFLVSASPWTVPISGYLFNVTGSSEKIFVFNYLIKLWIYHQLINYKLIIHFHYILIYLFIMFLNLSFFGHFKNSGYSEKSGSGFELQHSLFSNLTADEMVIKAFASCVVVRQYQLPILTCLI